MKYLYVALGLLFAACSQGEQRTPTGPSAVVLINCQDTRNEANDNTNTNTNIDVSVGDNTCGDRSTKNKPPVDPEGE